MSPKFYASEPSGSVEEAFSILSYVQSNLDGSNTFGTMKISSRHGKFEPMRVDYSAMSGGIIGISFRVSLT